MIDFNGFSRSYWNYYIELEKRMLETRRFVEFDVNNHKTFSSNFLMLFQSVCSEIDVVGKEIAAYFNEQFEHEDGKKPINRWWYEIQDNLIDINREIVFADSFPLKPWERFRVAQKISTQTRNGQQVAVTNYNLQPKTDGVEYATPKWWNAYNKVKHKRLKNDAEGVNYMKANLLNLSNAFAALYLLEFDFMNFIGNTQFIAKVEPSELFGMGNIQSAFINELFVTQDSLDINFQ